MSTRLAKLLKQSAPIVIITSNNEKELPDAFLRRCFFHFINFPDRMTMQRIVDVHFPKIKKTLVDEALDIFFDVRKIPGLKKKPSTSELVDWLKLVMSDDIPEDILDQPRPHQSDSTTVRCAVERMSRTFICWSVGLYDPPRGQ